MKQTKPTPRNLARLRRLCRERGISLDVIAAEASKTSRRGSVKRPTVSNVLAGRHKSANVVATVKRLLGEQRAS